jgi:hypothetical protein
VRISDFDAQVLALINKYNEEYSYYNIHTTLSTMLANNPNVSDSWMEKFLNIRESLEKLEESNMIIRIKFQTKEVYKITDDGITTLRHYIEGSPT